MIRPVLAPGLSVLRRSREELQVGRRGPRLPDAEPVRRTLDHLLRGEQPPDDPDARDVLDRLAPVLVDAAGLVDDRVAAGDVAAVALQDPAGYQRRLAARRRAAISVSGVLGDVDPRPLLAAAGLTLVDDPGCSNTPATAALVLGVGEVDRAVLDPLVRGRVPHLLVRTVEGTAVVGPFVEPGRTACLRCLDAHGAVDDPRPVAAPGWHPLAALDRHDGVPEPVDSALATIAVAWAVRDLVTHAEGDRPSTWSTTLRLGPALGSVTRAEWLRHPACGCSWEGTDQASGPPGDRPSSTMAV